MSIRHAEMSDLDRLAEIEAAGYPPAEGASGCWNGRGSSALLSTAL